MENRNHYNPEEENYGSSQSTRSGRFFAGFVIIMVGAALLIRQTGFIDLPYWLFSWKMLLIVIGIFIGAKSSFHNIGWVFPFFIGLFFLMEDFFPGLPLRHYLWPLIIIAAGVFTMFGPIGQNFRNRSLRQERRRQNLPEDDAGMAGGTAGVASHEEYIDSVSVFGSVKKNIITKDFKGGEIVTIFGGAEFNMAHADINGEVTLEVVQLFGGTRIIIPPHWEVKSELAAIFSSVEDKRPIQHDRNYESKKRLVLKGTSIFGGIDIISYY